MNTSLKNTLWILLFAVAVSAFVSVSVSVLAAEVEAAEAPVARVKRSSHKIRVMIDPGHGGEDDGAVVKEAREKDITLQVGLALKKILSSDPVFVPFMTRDHDQ